MTKMLFKKFFEFLVIVEEWWVCVYMLMCGREVMKRCKEWEHSIFSHFQHFQFHFETTGREISIDSGDHFNNPCSDELCLVSSPLWTSVPFESYRSAFPCICIPSLIPSLPHIPIFLRKARILF